MSSDAAPGSRPLSDRIRERIHREGPLPFDRFVEAALYDPDAGFFSVGRGAGRAARDFVTSPETGSLFGTMVARALDGWWRDLGAPDPFVVVEVGAGRGVLAREVLRAAPDCAPALRYVLVERSRALRAEQRTLLPLDDRAGAFGPGVIDVDIDADSVVGVPGSGPIVVSVDAFPAVGFTGVVFANELLDNLPFAMAEVRDGVWHEVRVGLDSEGHFAEVLVRLGERIAEAPFAGLPEPTTLDDGVRLPVLTALRDFVAEVAAHLRRGMLACVDYSESVSELVARGDGWLRTFRGHERGSTPLVEPGAYDITIDVPIEAFVAAVTGCGLDFVGATEQATWLRSLGIDAVAEDAAAKWRERAGVGDLAALAARSWVHEADALTDPAGLGAFRLLLAHKR